MTDRIQYQRGFAHRVFDAFGSTGFNTSENGQLGYFGPGGPWYAADGRWITRHPDGTLSVSGDDPEFLLMAIERYRKASTVNEFKRAQLYATGVDCCSLRARPDLDRELKQVYQDARLRLSLGPEPDPWPNLDDPADVWPQEVLDEVRCFLGLTVPAGKDWDDPANSPPFADVVEKTNLARVTRRAVAVLGAPDKATRWLDNPIRALEGRTPREVATTDVERVLAVLTRIAHGVHD